MKHLTPLKAIRKHCLACAKRPKDVRLCDTPDCYLFPFRMGHNDARKGIPPLKSVPRSILEGILPNSTTDSDKMMAKRRNAMPESRSCTRLKRVASGGISMSGQGKIQICRAGKEISIKVTTES